LAIPTIQPPKLIRSSPSPAYLLWLRGAIGAGLGIGLAAALSLLTIGSGSVAALPLLVAPIGASAVLVFAVPASPLAQPWSVIGGNLISALVGLAAGHLIGMPAVAASIAVSTAIVAMSLARCLHPPGGACALLYALGAAGPDHWGAPHLLVIAINVAGLSAVGWLYNNATGHSWPHRSVHVPPVLPGTHSARVHDALVAVLAEWNEVIDADVDDLEAIFQTVERRIRSAEHDAPPAALI
jgi:CBS domain-containing membrane protein